MRALETKKMLNHHPRTRNEHAVGDEAQKVYLREQVVEVFQAGVGREEGVGEEVFGRFERGGKQHTSGVKVIAASATSSAIVISRKARVIGSEIRKAGADSCRVGV